MYIGSWNIPVYALYRYFFNVTKTPGVQNPVLHVYPLLLPYLETFHICIYKKYRIIVHFARHFVKKWYNLEYILLKG